MCIIDINIVVQLKYRDLCNCFWCSTIVQVTELKLDSNERTAVQFKIERAYFQRIVYNLHPTISLKYAPLHLCAVG